jgi:hypothetical protein
VGRGLGVSTGLAVGEGLGEPLGVAVAVTVAVGVGAPAWAQYLPPVSKVFKLPPAPPQAIISLPVHTATWEKRAAGALVVLVAVQLSVPGSYRPPVFKKPPPLPPPQTIISLPVHTAV